MAQTTLSPHSSSGFVRGRNAVWATSRSAASGTTGEGFVGAELSGGNYDIYRFFDKFLTSSIPSGNTVSAVDYKIYPISRDTSTDFNVAIAGHTAPDTTLGTADYNNITLNSPTVTPGP